MRVLMYVSNDELISSLFRPNVGPELFYSFF